MPNRRSDNDNSSNDYNYYSYNYYSNDSTWSSYMERLLDTLVDILALNDTNPSGIEDFIGGAIERETNEGKKESNKKLSELNRFKKIKEKLRKIHKKGGVR